MIVKQVTDCVNDRKQVELCINSLLGNKGMVLHFSNLYYCCFILLVDCPEWHYGLHHVYNYKN